MVKEKNKKLLDEYFFLLGDRHLYPPLNNYSPFIQGSEYNTSRYFKKWFNNEVRLDMFLVCGHNKFQVWLPEDDFKKAAEIGFLEYFKDRKKFNDRIKLINKNIKLIDQIYYKNSYSEINKKNWRNLLKIVSDIRYLIWNANAAAFFSIQMDKEFLLELLAKYNLIYSNKEIKKIWSRAIRPYFASFHRNQNIDYLKKCVAGLSATELFESCQYFLTDYYSAKSLPEVSKYLAETYGKNNLSIIKARRDLYREGAEIKKLKDKYNKFLFLLSKREKSLVKYLQTLAEIRDRRKNFFAKGLTIIYRIAERMFNEVGIDKKLIPYYTIRELLLGVGYLKKNSVKKDLGARPKGFELLIPYSGRVRRESLNTNKDIISLDKRFVAGRGSDEQSLRGQTAYPGKVKGRVKIILKVDNQISFSVGRILVAGMTRPEYLSVMKKASAFITDEGGITCHAAIIAREMKKPCVIGTKIATKVLRDGDLVEVDAGKGVVRIIKRY